MHWRLRDTDPVPSQGSEVPQNARRAVPFEQLSYGTREQVRRLAKRGRLHPDAEIAASSLEFAHRSMSTRGRVSFIGGVAVDATVGMVLNDTGAGVRWPERIRNRRAAKRLIKLALQSGWEPPPWATVASDRGPMVRADELIRREGGSDSAPPAR
jgi:hypothetical protein